jgi:hypothetical protein
MPFLPRGSRGRSPQGNELPRRDHGLNLGKGARSRPLAQVQTIVGYGFVFLAGLSYGFLPYLSRAYLKRTCLVEVSSGKEYGRCYKRLEPGRCVEGAPSTRPGFLFSPLFLTVPFCWKHYLLP